MDYDLLLLGGTIHSSREASIADIGIAGGKIAAIGDLKAAASTERVDVTGLDLVPGLIDTQVHFREPGMEHKEDIQTGTQSAALGGITTVFEMPNTSPPTVTKEALEDKLRRAQGRSWCN